MITKGKSTTGRSLAAHLLKPENDRVEVLEIRGAVLNDLHEAIDDWRDFAKGTACGKPVYHAQLNPDRALSREEWNTAIGIFEKELGLEGYPRAVVLHEKEGREHLHLVYSRFNPDLEQERLRAWSDSWNYPKHERISREIERTLGLEKTQGVFIDRDGERPERTPSHDAMQQAERLDIDPRTVKAEVSDLYRQADTGRAFVAALQDAGYTLARGDRRGYVILDEKGGVHSLSRMAGVKAADLRESLRDFPLRDLPSVEEARAMPQERQREAGRPELDTDAPHMVPGLGNDSPLPEHAMTEFPGDRAEAKAAQEAELLPLPLEAQEPRAPEVSGPGFTEGLDADAPTAGPAKDGDGLTLDRAAVGLGGAALDGIARIGESLLDFLGGGSAPPSKEEREARTLTAKEEKTLRLEAQLKKYQQEDFERKQRQERGDDLEQGRRLELERDPTRKK